MAPETGTLPDDMDRCSPGLRPDLADLSARPERSSRIALQALEVLPDACIVIGAEGAVRYANAAARRWFEDLAQACSGASLPFAAPAHDECARIEVPCPDGRVRRLAVQATALGDEGEVLTLLTCRDETDAALMRESSRLLEARCELVERAAHDGLWHWELEREAMTFSPRWKAMLGFAECELGSHPRAWFDRVHPDDIEPLKASLSAHLQGRTPYIEIEYRIQHRDGAWRWMSCRALASRNDQGRATHLAGSQTDVTEQKDTKEELARRAFYDPLTDLPNRALSSTGCGTRCAAPGARRTTCSASCSSTSTVSRSSTTASGTWPATSC